MSKNQIANSGVWVWILIIHEQFTRLLIHHELALMRCILVAVPNRSDARDILRECSVSLWHQFGDYAPVRDFVQLALAFVKMEIRAFLRKSAWRNQLTEPSAKLQIKNSKKAAKTAFKLDQEPKTVQECCTIDPRQDLQDANNIGQQFSMPRRLIERRVPFVTVNNTG